MRNGHPDDYVGIGNYPVRILDQAVGYATLADGGQYRSSYFIQKVTDSKGNVLYQHKDAPKRVIDAKVANDVTLSMEQVAPTSGIGLNNGRPAAAKTGTVGIQDSGNSSDGWTVGFTPQVSAASWVGSDKVEPIYDANGNSEYGRDLAGHAWQAFMNHYLGGKPVMPLPTKQEIGLPTPAPSSSSASASSSSPTPTATPTPTLSSSVPPSSSAPPSSATPSCTPPAILVGGICVPPPTSSPPSSPTPTPTPAPTKSGATSTPSPGG
jgi:membrane peptidoglycan carboxypeptidase